MEKRLNEIKELWKKSINLELQGKYKEAVGLLEKAVKLNPNDGNLYNRLGDLYLKLSRVKEAINAYQNGIKAFRAENFLRNALALCKKILRYDPSNTEINFTIAELLIDLDEKSDAAMYLFSYIERQMAAGNKKEVTRAMELLKNLKLSESPVVNKLQAMADKIEEKKKAEESPPSPPSLAEKITEMDIAELEIQPVPTGEDFKNSVLSSDSTKVIEQNIIPRLENLTEEIERVALELRRAMRIDEVVVALDKSLNIFSQQQKEAIHLLCKTLNDDLVNLRKTIAELLAGTRINIDKLEDIFGNLRNTLNDINHHQRLLIEELGRGFDDVGGRIESALLKMLEDLRNFTEAYEKANQEIYAKVAENSQLTNAVLKMSGETKIGIQTINESLLKFFLSQDAQIKKLNKFVFLIAAILAGVVILHLLNLFLK